MKWFVWFIVFVFCVRIDACEKCLHSIEILEAEVVNDLGLPIGHGMYLYYLGGVEYTKQAKQIILRCKCYEGLIQNDFSD